MKIFYGVFAYIGLLITDLLMVKLKERNAKKCNYNCKNCKNWDCFKIYCDKKRNEVKNGS